MKKYKLLQTYPGLTGSIEEGDTVEYYFNWDLYGKENLCYVGLTKDVVENNPKFWKKVVEKDYEVISIVDKNNSKDIRKAVGWGNMDSDWLEKVAVGDPWIIRSVKRLSDGELFILGDAAKTITSRGQHKINNFKIKQKAINKDKKTGELIRDGIDRIWVYWGNDEGGNWLDKIEHCIKPLFITEDGKEIFEGDIFYWIPKNFDCVFTSTAKKGTTQTDSNRYKKFSKKETAVEYFLMNSPCLSVNDVFRIYPQFKKGCSKTLTNHAEDLIRLVRQ